jgi:hypothetical protein
MATMRKRLERIEGEVRFREWIGSERMLELAATIEKLGFPCSNLTWSPSPNKPREDSDQAVARGVPSG